MPKIKDKEKRIIEAIPVAIGQNGDEIKVDYYTKAGQEIPREFIGKTIVIAVASEEE